jgi:hypothetical protein
LSRIVVPRSRKVPAVDIADRIEQYTIISKNDKDKTHDINE